MKYICIRLRRGFLSDRSAVTMPPLTSRGLLMNETAKLTPEHFMQIGGPDSMVL